MSPFDPLGFTRDVNFRPIGKRILQGTSEVFTSLDRPRGAIVSALQLKNPLEGFKNPSQYHGVDVGLAKLFQSQNIIGGLSLRDIVGGATDIAVDPVNIATGLGVFGKAKYLGPLAGFAQPVSASANPARRLASMYGLAAGATAGSRLGS